MRKILIIALITIIATSGCIGTFEPSAGEVSDLSNDGHSEMESLNGTLVISNGTETGSIEVKIQNTSDGWTSAKVVDQTTENSADQSDTNGTTGSSDEDTANGEVNTANTSAPNSGNNPSQPSQNTTGTNTTDSSPDETNPENSPDNEEESVSESPQEKRLHEVVNGTVLLESARILRELPESEYDMQNVGPGDSVSNYSTYRIELTRENRDRIIQVHRDYWYPLTTNITEGNETVKSVKLNASQIRSQ